MKLTEPELRDLYQEFNPPSACLSEDVLVNAGRGRLSAQERDLVVAHVGRCANCAREYQAAYAMRELEVTRPRRMPWLALAAAAVMLLPWFGLLRSTITQRRDARTIASLEERVRTAEQKAAVPARVVTVTEPTVPLMDMPIVDVDSDVTRGTSDGLATVDAANRFTLILHLDQPVRPPLPVSIWTADGAILWKETWTPKPGVVSLTLTLDKNQFGPGHYRVRIGDTSFRFHVR